MKKYIFIIFSLSLIFSCDKKTDKFVETKKPIHKIFAASSEDVISNFKKFRQAVYQNDLKNVKSFIDFPFKSKDACSLVDENTSKDILTEKDFDKYHDKIFSKMFLETVLKINTSELLRKGTTTTQYLKFNNKKSKITAAFEKPDALILSLLSESYIENLDWKPEQEIIYEFIVLKTGKIKLFNILIAG